MACDHIQFNHVSFARAITEDMMCQWGYRDANSSTSYSLGASTTRMLGYAIPKLSKTEPVPKNNASPSQPSFGAKATGKCHWPSASKCQVCMLFKVSCLLIAQNITFAFLQFLNLHQGHPGPRSQVNLLLVSSQFNCSRRTNYTSIIFITARQTQQSIYKFLSHVQCNHSIPWHFNSLCKPPQFPFHAPHLRIMLQGNQII